MKGKFTYILGASVILLAGCAQAHDATSMAQIECMASGHVLAKGEGCKKPFVLNSLIRDGVIKTDGLCPPGKTFTKNDDMSLDYANGKLWVKCK